MTGASFGYEDDMISHGGSGDDILWAGPGNDILYGDSGNDYIHGGGGDDSFVFGTAWGNDKIAQSYGGTITLYFENPDVYFDAEKQVYTDGENTLDIIGSASVKIGDINLLA